jgi:transglutaminase-like putative cysteine protease
MHRLAPVLLIGGVVLLATSLRAPAAPTTAPVRASIELMDAQASATLTEVTQQVERLRERLASPPDAPVADRDPFNFGRRAAPAPTTAPVDLPAVEPPPPALPRLVAIVADIASDGAVSRRAFVAFAGDVVQVRIGDTLGAFVVRAIADDALELFDAARSATHRIRID